MGPRGVVSCNGRFAVSPERTFAIGERSRVPSPTMGYSRAPRVPRSFLVQYAERVSHGPRHTHPIRCD